MRFPLRGLLVSASLLTAALNARAQQTSPAPATLSDDSVRVMAGLVQSSVQQLRCIYFEPNDTRATELIDAALVTIPQLNQRLSHYTASLPREQQQLLAQRLRQQPWQIELQTLMRSPQVHAFDARAAKNPGLKAAAERLHASGFAGTARVTAPAIPAAPAEPTATLIFVPAKGHKAAPGTTSLAAAKPTLAPATSAAAPAPTKPGATPAAAAALHHTVQKGDTLFGICRQYGVTPDQLRAWNHKQDDAVRIGEVLVLNAPK